MKKKKRTDDFNDLHIAGLQFISNTVSDHLLNISRMEYKYLHEK